MPAIDPERVRQQADDIARLVEDPQQVADGAMELLAFYTDRTRRPPASARADDAIRQFGAPTPIVRMLGRAVEEALQVVPQQRRPLVEAFWGTGYREPRLLAAELIGNMSWDEAHRLAEDYVLASSDARVHSRLARSLFRSGLSTPQENVRETLRRWLRSDAQMIQRLALRVVKRQVEAAPAAELPGYFEILQGLVGKLQPGALAAARDAYSAIIHRSPPEAAQFLIDELRRHPREEAYREFIREVKEDLPEPQRAELTAVLSR